MNPTPIYPDATPCRNAMVEALNLYLDGELAAETQPLLFAHLALCEACRRRFDAVLSFRRMSRQECIHVPPAVDDQFFERLAKHKASGLRFDRVADRRPLWQRRAVVSLRVVVLVALLLFLGGVLLPGQRAADQEALAQEVFGEEELIELADYDWPARRLEAVYVFYPGLTIEASKTTGNGQ